MRQILISAIVAAVVCVGLFLVDDRFDDDGTAAVTPEAAAGSRAPLSLRYTDEPAEDSWVAGARGHWELVGTPSQIADELESWFVNEGADGFNLMPPVLPTGLDDIVELLLPELRRRGLFREEYEGSTLRDHLGLARPENRFSAARSAQSAE